MYYKEYLAKFNQNEILNKGFSALVLRVLGMAFAYIFLILVTSTSGAETWGIFALCLGVLNIACIISKFGLDLSLVKLVSINNKSKEKVKGLYFQSILIVIIISSLITLLIYFSSTYIASEFFLKPHMHSFIKMISFLVLPYSLLSINASIFRGLKKTKIFVFFKFTTNFIFAILIYFLIINLDHDLVLHEIPIWAFGIGIIVSLILSCVFIFNLLKNSDQNENIISYKYLLKTSYPMMLSAAALLLLSWVDTLMIGRYQTESDVGIYNVAVRVATLTSIVMTAVGAILGPKIAESYANARIDELKPLWRKSRVLIFGCTLPILVVLAIFPSFFLSIFGDEFIMAKNAFMILLVAQLITVFFGPVGLFLQMSGNEIVFQKIILSAVILNIILNLVLIPYLGIVGAAISSLISMFLMSFLSHLCINRMLIIIE